MSAVYPEALLRSSRATGLPVGDRDDRALVLPVDERWRLGEEVCLTKAQPLPILVGFRLSEVTKVAIGRQAGQRLGHGLDNVQGLGIFLVNPLRKAIHDRLLAIRHTLFVLG